MAKRPDISVILVTNDAVVRADFNRKSELVFSLREAVDVESSFTDSVRHVVSGKPNLAVKTIVASTEVWSQVILMPRMSMGGIDPVELEEALKFEAETLSGIEIDEIVIASSPLGARNDFEQFWVSAIRKSDLDAVNGLLESKGCRDIVVASPVGISGDPMSQGSEISMEVWDGSCYLLSRDSSRLVKVQPFSDTHVANDGQNVSRLLGVGIDAVDNLTIIEDLEQDVHFEKWAAAVAGNFANRLDQIAAPLIRQVKGSSATPARHLLSGSIALAALGFCFWHWHNVNSYNDRLNVQIAEMKRPAEQKKQFDAQLLNVLEQRSEIQGLDSTLGDDLKRIQFFLDNQSNRIAKLLELLVEQRTPNLVIEQISGNEQGLMLSGTSLNGEAAQALAKRLREEVAPMGWVVNPAKQVGQQMLTTGGPWTYEITLTDTGPFDPVMLLRRTLSGEPFKKF